MKLVWVVIFLLFAVTLNAQTSQTVTFNAASTAFSSSVNIGITTLTSNLTTFTITNGTTPGQNFTLEFCQDSVGSHIINSGAPNYSGGINVDPTVFSCTLFSTVWVNNTWVLNNRSVLPNSSANTFSNVSGNALTGSLLASGITSAPGLTTVAGGTLGTAAFTNSNAYDTAGTASSFIPPLLKTSTNCSSIVSPAVCSSAPTGSFVIGVGNTNIVVNTTAVTSNSIIIITPDQSLSNKLGVTCNTSMPSIGVTTRQPGTSFTTTNIIAPTSNPVCYSYIVLN